MTGLVEGTSFYSCHLRTAQPMRRFIATSRNHVAPCVSDTRPATPSAQVITLWRHIHSTPRRQNEVPSHKLPRIHPDVSSILEDPEAVAKNIRRRKSPVPRQYDSPEAFVQDIVKLQSEVRNLGEQVRQLQSERNALSAVYKQKSATNEEKDIAKRKAEAIRSRVQGSSGVEAQFASQETRLLSLAAQLPNDTSDGTPDGGYDACVTVKTTTNAAIPTTLQSIPAADHVNLLTQLGWLYLPTHITGASWPYLVGGGAQLELALTQYAVSCALKHGYDLVLPPDVVKSEIMRRCGFNPRDAGGESQTYFVRTSAEISSDNMSEPELALAATAEVPLAGFFMNRRFKAPATDLPKKALAFGHAFRAEAGARGREARGLYRVHQFSKVELFAVTESNLETSQDMLQQMVELQWDILSGLDLPLRLLRMSTEELGSSAYEKYDIEAWMPGRGSWGELASASNCTTYQARRLDIRHTTHQQGAQQLTKTGRTAFCHTLNATAAAMPRLIVALIENGAVFDERGEWIALQLPTALRKHWLGKEGQVDDLRINLPHPFGRVRTIDLQWI